MILLDNSSFARNGDAIPSRFQAQLDAASSVINYKTNDNMETCVGLMSIAGAGGQIYSTPTNEASAIYSQFNKIQIQGQAHFAKSLQIAQLALKHRVNKNQHERLIIFVASEIKDTPEELFVVAKNLRRNGVALDIINICNEQNLRVLEQIIEIVNVDDNSHLVNYQGGLTLLSDVLKTSGVFGRTGGAEDLGFQEEMDPELEMVLRISLEEEKKRQDEIDRQNRQPTAPQESRGMQIEHDSNPKDEETAHLLSQAQDVINESQGQPKPQNEFINDKEFIKEILKDLKIDPKNQEKKDDKDKKE
jgi:26S proteasome regulatory subunit N10